MGENKEEKKTQGNSRQSEKKNRNEKSKFSSILGRIFSILLAIILVVVAITFGVTYYATAKLNIQYSDLIYKYSKENDLDPFLVASIISIESSYDEEAESHAGAIGLMQIMPDTAKWISEQISVDYSISKLTDPEFNIQLGTNYIKYLLDYYNSEHLALAAYNGGMGNVDNWLDSGEITSERDDIENIPYREPREYVTKVERRKELIELFYEEDGLPNEGDNNLGLAFDNYIDYFNRLIEEF